MYAWTLGAEKAWTNTTLYCVQHVLGSTTTNMRSLTYQLGVFDGAVNLSNQTHLDLRYAQAVQLERQLSAAVGVTSGVTRVPVTNGVAGSISWANNNNYWEDIGNSPWEAYYPLVNVVSFVFRATISFTQAGIDLWGHTHYQPDGAPAHIQAIIVYDITDARTVLYLARVGESPTYLTPSMPSLSCIAGHHYHMMVFNLKTIYIYNGDVKVYSTILNGGTGYYSSAVKLVDATPSFASAPPAPLPPRERLLTVLASFLNDPLSVLFLRSCCMTLTLRKA